MFEINFDYIEVKRNRDKLEEIKEAIRAVERKIEPLQQEHNIRKDGTEGLLAYITAHLCLPFEKSGIEILQKDYRTNENQ